VFVLYLVLIVIGAVLLAVDLFIVIGLAVTLPVALWLAVRGTLTTGHVVRVNERRRRPGRTTPVRVAYGTPAGTLQTRGTSPEARIGEPIPVRYLPARPALCTTMTRPVRQAATSVPLALAVGALSVGAIIAAVWYFTGTHTQLQLPLGSGAVVWLITLAFGWYAVSRYGMLLRWRRMVQAAGTIKRYEEPAPGSGMPGNILISFRSADGDEEFLAQAGSALPGGGDSVTVYYDPSAPAHSATVQTSSQVRAYAIFCTVAAVVFAFIGVYALTQL
jgi:hypothetical protein